MFCKNNSSFRAVTMMQKWNIRHTVVVLCRYFIRLRCFFIIFQCKHGHLTVALASLAASHAWKGILNINRSSLSSSCVLFLFHCHVASLSTQKHILCEWARHMWAVNHVRRHAFGSLFSFYIYIYAFSRRFYPKRLTIAFRLYIFISTCFPWKKSPSPICTAFSQGSPGADWQNQYKLYDIRWPNQSQGREFVCQGFKKNLHSNDLYRTFIWIYFRRLIWLDDVFYVTAL